MGQHITWTTGTFRPKLVEAYALIISANASIGGNFAVVSYSFPKENPKCVVIDVNAIAREIVGHQEAINTTYELILQRFHREERSIDHFPTHYKVGEGDREPKPITQLVRPDLEEA